MQKKNKYMIVTGSLGMGGLEKIVTNLANLLSKQGNDVSIVCLFDANDPYFPLEKNIKVFSFNGKNNRLSKILNIRKWISFLKKIFREEQPTNVLAMTLKISGLCSLAKKKNQFRLVLREITDPKSKKRSRFFDTFLFHICRNKVDALIFQTEWEKSCYPKYLRNKGFVVPNPAVVNVEKSTNRKKEIVTMGRIVNETKRHDILIEAFSIFSKKNDDYKLIIYGKGPDLEKNIKLAKKLGVEDKVLFPGPKENILVQIRDASCFVLTSEYEGMSNALIEALLIGVPCITTDWNGAGEIITNEVNGLVVEKNNPTALADAINKIVSNPELMEKFADNGVKERDKYKFENTYLKYIKILKGEI